MQIKTKINRENQVKNITRRHIAGIKEKVQVEALGSIDKSGEFDKDAFMNNLKNNLTLTDSDIIENTDGTNTATVPILILHQPIQHLQIQGICQQTYNQQQMMQQIMKKRKEMQY